MNEETYEALKNIVKETKLFTNEKYGKRKRLNQDEIWHKAIIIRDTVQIENWIDEVAKEYEPETTKCEGYNCNNCEFACI